MIAVSLESPSTPSIKYQLGRVTSVTSTKAELGNQMHHVGVIIAASIPPDLLEVQGQQSGEPRWKIIVNDGKNTYEFAGVWFHATYRESRFRIDFGSQAGPSSLHLSNPL